VCINDIASEIQTVKCGVPQGSILGPLLFIIYINDIINVSSLVNMILFADDTNIFISGNHIDDIVDTMNNELNKLSKWFKLNKLSLNVKKNNFIIFRSKNKKLKQIPEIKIDNTKIDQVSCTKFLGVIINETLTWCDHIKLIRQKVCKSIGIIRHIKKNMPCDVLRMLYFTLINPYYDYCNLVWGIGNTTALNNLYLTQKRAIRVITSSSWNSHTEPLKKKMNILKLHDLNKLLIASFMYKIHVGLLPAYFIGMFKMNYDVHSYNTRQKNNYHITRHRINLMKRTVRIAGPLVWNAINIDITKTPSLNAFKNKFRKCLLDTYSI
jgi:hypothetical protein